MHVVIAGASGLLGSHLASELQRAGHTVVGLTRSDTQEPGMSTWNPTDGQYDRDLFERQLLELVEVELAKRHVAGAADTPFGLREKQGIVIEQLPGSRARNTPRQAPPCRACAAADIDDRGRFGLFEAPR